MKKLEVVPERREYQPGEVIQGTVRWSLDEAPRGAELRIFWRTEGKGSRDTLTVQQLVFEMAQAEDFRSFSLTAPAFPPSFSGKLISLVWSLELVLQPGGSEVVDLVIGREGRELDLHRPEWLVLPAPKKPTFRWGR